MRFSAPSQEKTQSFKKGIRVSGYKGIRVFVFPKTNLKAFRVYEIKFKDHLSANSIFKKAKTLSEKLFVDTICEKYEVSCNLKSLPHTLIPSYPHTPSCIVWFKDSVYDAEGEMALYCAQRLGLGDGIKKIKFGRGYKLVPRHAYSVKQLFNPLVEYLEKL